MRTPRHSSRPLPSGLVCLVAGGVWMACLNPQPDQFPTERPSEGGTVDVPQGTPGGGAGSAAVMGAGNGDDSGGGAAGSSGAGVEAPAPDAGAPLDTSGPDGGPSPDAGLRSLRQDAGPNGGGAQ
jgi:hypothetical protein